jgi:hypothetical protein
MSNKSVNKVILLGSVGHDPEVKSPQAVFRSEDSAWRPMKDSRTRVANSRTAQNGTTLWSGGGLPRSWASSCRKALSCMSKENSKVRVGKTGRAGRRHSGPRLWPMTWCFWAREGRKMQPRDRLQTGLRNQGQRIQPLLGLPRCPITSSRFEVSLQRPPRFRAR